MLNLYMEVDQKETEEVWRAAAQIDQLKDLKEATDRLLKQQYFCERIAHWISAFNDQKAKINSRSEGPCNADDTKEIILSMGSVLKEFLENCKSSLAASFDKGNYDSNH